MVISSYLQKTGKDVELYLVKWKGWSAKYNTWEPASNMEDCQEHITTFMNLIANGLTTQVHSIDPILARFRFCAVPGPNYNER